MSSGRGVRQTDDDATLEEEPMPFDPYLFFGGDCREAFTR